jgi:hypothetical protein
MYGILKDEVKYRRARFNSSLCRACCLQVREHPGDGGRGARPHHHGGARTDRSARGESLLSSS